QFVASNANLTLTIPDGPTGGNCRKSPVATIFEARTCIPPKGSEFFFNKHAICESLSNSVPSSMET
ncbi:hypothetical protein B0H16DRAFT_1224982, partial [Mycena metata]